ncbi:unnamed protein product, partial [Chrysoparadoxa australica]
STNLLVSDALKEASGVGLGFFDPLWPGAILAGVGLIYILFVLPKLLPRHEEGDDAGADSAGKQYIAQIEIHPDHPLDGQKPVAGLFPGLQDITVRMIQRGQESLLPPFDDVELRPGDEVIVAATRKRLTELLSSRSEFVRGVIRSAGPNDGPTRGERLALAEAVVSPGSRLIGRTVRQ